MAKAALIFLLFFFGQTEENIKPEDQLILINLESMILQFFEKGNLICEFPVRIGAPGSPTPTGEGYIYIKRDRPVFRYVDPGPKQGQIIDYAECADGLKKVHRSKMRALGIRIKNTDKYSIHSTTCSETIGMAISRGCIGMKVDDMLVLYPKVIKGAKVKIVKELKTPQN